MPTEVERIVEWLRAEVSSAGKSAAVVGLSGGIDSATVAALAKQAFGDRAFGVIMPCDSDPKDAEDARLVAEAIGMQHRIVDLTPVYQLLRETLGLPDGAPRLAIANLKPRLRMITLYAEAAVRGALVLGTGNRAELEIGYFTKYGDGGVDLLPLGGFLKREVRELARQIGVPQRTIDRQPSAGLWEGQTDEAEMGMSYAELDQFLATGEGSAVVSGLVDNLHRASEHKRRLPSVFPR
ncbi:MAG: NAD(+) synthase [Thermaerobacter sp.]|nr:NAD(+) synthase [Thermaerobacter sp.]